MGDSLLAVEVEGLAKSFGPKRILHEVRFSVPAGKLMAITGPSGSGKTTLLRAVAGLEPIDAGHIHIGGRSVSRPGFRVPPEKRGIAMTFQEGALWPHMTAEKHLRFVLRAHRLSVPETETRIRHVLEVVDLADRGTARPHELSGGEQQRLGIARALCVDAPLLLMDEPFAHLDEARTVRILTEIKERVCAGRSTVLLATHNETLLDADLVSRMGNACGNES